MKLIALLLFVGVSSAGRLESTYLPPGSAASAGGSASFLSAPRQRFGGAAQTLGGSLQTFRGTSFRPGAGFSLKSSSQTHTVNALHTVGAYQSDDSYQAGKAATFHAKTQPHVPILKFYNENVEGTYKYGFETANGISADEEGHQTSPDSQEARGSYSYTAPDGQYVSVEYTAGENGFEAFGDHIPTAPPLPEEILESLKQNAEEEARGIFDDGSYKPSADEIREFGLGGSPVIVSKAAGYQGNQFGLRPIAAGVRKPTLSISKQYIAPKKTTFSSSTGYHY